MDDTDQEFWSVVNHSLTDEDDGRPTRWEMAAWFVTFVVLIGLLVIGPIWVVFL